MTQQRLCALAFGFVIASFSCGLVWSQTLPTAEQAKKASPAKVAKQVFDVLAASVDEKFVDTPGLPPVVAFSPQEMATVMADGGKAPMKRLDLRTQARATAIRGVCEAYDFHFGFDRKADSRAALSNLDFNKRYYFTDLFDRPDGETRCQDAGHGLVADSAFSAAEGYRLFNQLKARPRDDSRPCRPEVKDPKVCDFTALAKDGLMSVSMLRNEERSLDGGPELEFTRISTYVLVIAGDGSTQWRVEVDLRDGDLVQSTWRYAQYGDA